MWPNPYVGYSAELLPEIREFERTSTTALNAYLQPVLATYLGKLEDALASGRFQGSFHIVQSNGGVMSAAMARKHPIRTALSGPAAGVIAAGAIAHAAGVRDVITADLGGTSFDVSLIADGTPTLAAQSTIDFGLVIRTPMVEITTIGAGEHHRPCRRRRPSRGWAGERRITSGSSLLWCGQHAAYSDRR